METNERKVYVSFHGQEVAVSSPFPEVISTVEISFERLLTSKPTELLYSFRVDSGPEGYYVEGAGDLVPVDGTLRNALQCLKFEIIHRFVGQHPEMLWLHAGSASWNGKAAILCGAWGRGKSTMVSNLCMKGWTYLSDDIVPIDMNTGKLVPFPLTPMMRTHDAEVHAEVLTPQQVSTLKKQLIALEDNAIAQENVTPFAVIFPRYTPDAPIELTSFAPAPATLELLQNCLNLKYHKEEAVRYLGQLVEQYPVYGLQYDDGDKASDEIIALRAHL